MLNRNIAPPIVDAVNFNLELQPYQKYILNNGVEVYAVNVGTEDVMLVEWVFDAGNWYEEKNLQAAVTNHLLKNGTSQKSAYDITEHFEYYGSYLNRNCFTETSNISLHCLTKHVNHHRLRHSTKRNEYRHSEHEAKVGCESEKKQLRGRPVD
jgi:hypothetical protein